MLQYHPEAPLLQYNTLGLMAHAKALVSVSTESELTAALAWAKARELPVVPLGEGSNIVLAGDLNVLVLRQVTCGIEQLELADETVSLRVAAGENWHDFVRWTLQQGYSGLENLALIPGTVGAAPLQNIGAYGVEVASFVTRVHARQLSDGSELTLAHSDCEFGYRDSVFKGTLRDQVVITAVELALNRRPHVHTAYPALAAALGDLASSATPQQVFEAVVNIRSSKLPDPAVEPNAGSFFKNPVLSGERAHELCARYPGLPNYPQDGGLVKLSAAWLIEHCGWRGYRRNDQGVHPQHALVLVNYGNDSGGQLLILARDIVASLVDTFGVQLEIEPRIYGSAT